MNTASDLLALAEHGKTYTGEHRCFYCGSRCDESHTTKEWVKSTFFDWPDVAFPGSGFVCYGCTLSLAEKIDIIGKDKKQKRRSYSWYITPKVALPYTKANLETITQLLINPQDPPWSLALAASGQKHLIYRTPVNYQPNPPYRVRLEIEVVEYTPETLKQRLELCQLIVEPLGKPSLQERLSARAVIILATLHGRNAAIEIADQWNPVVDQPLTRLAAFICPSMETLKNARNEKAESA